MAQRRLCGNIQMAEEKRKVSLGFKMFLILFEVVVIGAILGGAWLLNKTLLAPPLIVSFRFTRVEIEKKYAILHCATIMACMILSTSICWLGVYMALPMSVSFISNIIVGAIFAYITWKIQEYLDIEEKYRELTKDKKQILIDRCKKLNYSELKTEIAIKFFIEKLKPKEVWEWLCNVKHEYVECDSVYQSKWRMKKELFKNNLE